MLEGSHDQSIKKSEEKLKKMKKELEAALGEIEGSKAREKEANEGCKTSEMRLKNTDEKVKTGEKARERENPLKS